MPWADFRTWLGAPPVTASDRGLEAVAVLRGDRTRQGASTSGSRHEPCCCWCGAASASPKIHTGTASLHDRPARSSFWLPAGTTGPRPTSTCCFWARWRSRSFAKERTKPPCCDELGEPPADAGLAEALAAAVSPSARTAPLPVDRPRTAPAHEQPHIVTFPFAHRCWPLLSFLDRHCP